MRIAVVGSGIAGLASAWLLSQSHEVVLYEAENRLGGHTHTHDIVLGDTQWRVDSGFIVHNPTHYPRLTGFLDALGVDSQPTTMGFSVHEEATGLEYNATSLDGLFCQRRNLASGRMWSMLADLRRFYRESPALLADTGAGPTLEDYLAANRYGDAFRDLHLVPMASALWSSPAREILKFPARYLVQFMANHHMLQMTGRPEWRVVAGGSSRYVEALEARWDVEVRLGQPVLGVQRAPSGPQVTTDRGTVQFDHVVLACHSDQALALLGDASAAERDILGAIPYQANDAVLHTDARLLPRDRRAWAAWNAFVPAAAGAHCTVSYCMNLLQSLDAPQPLVVTLNRTADIDPAHVLRRMTYHHPVYTPASVAAQSRRGEIQGRNGTWFAGAYWGWGFHEDGARSAVEVARDMGVSTAWPTA